MDPGSPTVFIVDDDAAVRSALAALLGSVNLRTSTHGSAQHFLETYRPVRVGCLIVDVRLPGVSGLELQPLLHERGIDLPLIMISGHNDVASAVRAMKAGAIDFLQKPINAQVLIETVQRAVSESLAVADTRARTDRTRILLGALTRRERDVLDGIVGGEPNKRIAARLNIAEKTVEAHRARLMSKLEAKNVVDLVKTVLATGSRENPDWRRDVPDR